jgi:hypothetical protein
MNLLRLVGRNAPMPRVVVPDEFGSSTADDQWGIKIMRGRQVAESVHHGPNIWTATVIHPDGSYDISQGQNLLTTVGRDLIAAAYGNFAGKDGALTASSSTSATPAGGGMTVDAYKGHRVWCPVTGLTTAPVYGNIGSNSATVLTVDGWWIGTSDTMTGGTPASTNGYHIQPSVLARFMGVSAEGTAPVVGDTTLASEQTANGLGRAKATYAHTPAAATYTLINSYSVTGSVTVHKGALFTAANTTAAGVMVFAAVLNADAIVANLDTLQVTATVTLT